jgi:phosphoglycolate phosphatase-like HAD superfamily hydrolase
MSFNIDITGLQKLQREFEEAAQGLKSLDGTIASLSNDPDNPNDAVRQMELAIDKKVAAYRGNTLVSQLVRQMKEEYRERILELARNGGT